MLYTELQKQTHSEAPRSPLTPAGRRSKTMPHIAPKCPRMPRRFAVWQNEPKLVAVTRASRPCEGFKHGRDARVTERHVQECSTMFRNVQLCSAPAKSAKR